VFRVIGKVDRQGQAIHCVSANGKRSRMNIILSQLFIIYDEPRL
jgi:hypothetical protein